MATAPAWDPWAVGPRKLNQGTMDWLNTNPEYGAVQDGFRYYPQTTGGSLSTGTGEMTPATPSGWSRVAVDPSGANIGRDFENYNTSGDYTDTFINGGRTFLDKAVPIVGAAANAYALGQGALAVLGPEAASAAFTPIDAASFGLSGVAPLSADALGMASVGGTLAPLAGGGGGAAAGAGAGAAGVGAAGAGAGGAGSALSSLASDITAKDVIGAAGLAAGVAANANTPDAPDYLALAKEQGNQNRLTNEANLIANRPDINTPVGSSTWAKGADGRWTNTITQSPEEAALQTLTGGVKRGAADFAGDMLPGVRAGLETPFSLGGIRSPEYVNSGPVQAQGGMPTAPAGARFGATNPAGRTIGSTALPTQELAGNGPSLGSMGPGPQLGKVGAPESLGRLDPAMAQGPEYQLPGGPGPQFQRLGGGAGGGSVSVGADPNYDFLQGKGPGLGRVQEDVSQAGRRFSPFGLQGPEARDLYGQTGYEGSRGQVQDSYFQRQSRLLEPGMQRAEAGLDLQLRNQGLMPGTEGYDNAMSELRQSQSQQRADLADRAIQAGGSEQSRLAGLDLSADAQRFDQQQTGFGNELSKVKYGNEQDLQNLEAQMGVGRFNREGAQGEFGNEVTSLGVNNTLKRNLVQDNFERQMGAANVANAGAANANAFALGAGRLNFEQGQQEFLNDRADLRYSNDLARQASTDQFGRTMDIANFNRAGTQGDFTNQVTGAGFNRASDQAGFDNQLASAGFNRAGVQGEFNNAQTGLTQRNAAGQTAFGNLMSLGTYNAGQDAANYGREVQAFGLNAGQAQQDFTNQMDSARLGWDVGFRNQGAQQSAAGVNNQTRAGQVDETFRTRQQPINEFAQFAALGGNAQMPATQPFGMSNTQAPNLYQAGTDQYNAAANQYNAQIGNYQQLLNLASRWWG